MFRRKLMDVEPDEEWDPNKKYFLKELKQANFEKMVYIGCLIGLVLLWKVWLQPKLVLDPEWNNNATDAQLTSYFGREFITQ